MMQLLVNSMPGFVFWKSLDLKYLGANQRFIEFLGLENQKQLIGKKDEDLNITSSQLDYISKFDLQVIQTEHPHYKITESFSQINNCFMTLVTNKYPLYDDSHNLIGILCLSTIEDERQSNVQTYLENIIASVPYTIFWKNVNSVYLGCNKKFSSLVGKTPQEVIGKTDFELGWKEGEAELFYQGDREIMFGNNKVNVEETLLQPDGSKKIMLVSKVPVFDKDEKCIGVLGVSVDITDRKKMEQDLIVAKEAAESANLAKTEFITNMSHDIRTPLSGVIGMSKIIEDKTSSPENKQYAHWVNESGKQLLGLLNGILDVISADNVNDNELHNETFDLRLCIQDIAQLEMPTIKMKNLELHISIQDEIPQYLISDRTKIHRILLNLLGNSIKFTKVGHVGIDIALIAQLKDEVLLRFSIFDTGIGIPPELQSSVFDRFFRVNSLKSTYQGHGIGLHIARSYVELLGGVIKLESEINKGTTFSFEVRLQVGREENNKPLTTRESFDKKPLKSKNLSLDPSESPYLLLIEDNLIGLRTVELLATEAGCRYQSADNAESAFKLIQSTHFDLILTDLGLPGMSGMELTQKIRAWEQATGSPPTPIIGLTAHAGKNEVEKCQQAGMNKVLIKPASIIMIMNLIDEYITNKLALPSSIPKVDTTNSLGTDLPNTEEELFALDKFPILDVKSGVRILGSETILIEMLAIMLKECEELEKRPKQQAQKPNDWHAIEALAHKMKGGASYCGTIKMQMACQYLERYHKGGHSKLLQPLYEQFLVVVGETKLFLTQWLSKKE